MGSIQQLREVSALVAGSWPGMTGAPPIELYPIEDVNNALDKLRAHKITGRAVLTFDCLVITTYSNDMLRVVTISI